VQLALVDAAGGLGARVATHRGTVAAWLDGRLGDESLPAVVRFAAAVARARTALGSVP
jgi:hypothetical protein